MKWLVILALLAAGGFVAYKKFKPVEPPPVSDPTKTPGADMKNRIDNLSGTAPE